MSADAVTPIGYLQQFQDRTLEELIEFAAIPSVSTDSSYQAAMQQAAQWVAAQLQVAGMQVVEVMPTARHPVVYAEWCQASNRPTLLVYGHYDVQPPDPLDKWQSSPFVPQVRNGRLFGRGVSDDKGPLLIPIKVAQAFLSTTASLPVNVKFLIEGEEEIGSPSLPEFIAAHRQMLSADFVLSADGAMWRVDVPSITVASRGLCSLEFTVTGAAKDLHSGRHGGAVANPLHAMSLLVSSLHTAGGRVAVSGFYDDVQELADRQRHAMARLPFTDDDYLRQVGAPAPFGEPGYSTLERMWTRPTLEINGMWGGYQGEGDKTVIPSAAHAKITCRLVPDQNPSEIVDRICQHLTGHLPPGVDLEIRRGDHARRAYNIPDDHVGLSIAEAVLSELYGEQPLRVRMGGTLPVSELFQRLLGIDTVFFSFSTADEDFHAPNEFFRLSRLQEGLRAWTRYWELLAGYSFGS